MMRLLMPLLVYGPCHVVDHREAADGFQKVIIWPWRKKKKTSQIKTALIDENIYIYIFL